VGDVIYDPATEKYFQVERLMTHFGLRYLLRSLESGNPGNPKSSQFLDLQIADKFLVRMTFLQYLRATR
jgi:hypothetical protein